MCTEVVVVGVAIVVAAAGAATGATYAGAGAATGSGVAGLRGMAIGVCLDTRLFVEPLSVFAVAFANFFITHLSFFGAGERRGFLCVFIHAAVAVLSLFADLTAVAFCTDDWRASRWSIAPTKSCW